MKASSTLPFSPGLAGLFRGYSRRIRPHPASSRTTPEDTPPGGRAVQGVRSRQNPGNFGGAPCPSFSRKKCKKPALPLGA